MSTKENNIIDTSITNIILKYLELKEKQKYYVSGLIRGLAMDKEEKKDKGV